MDEAKPSVLIVDDDVSLATVLAKQLAQAEMLPRAGTGGAEALALLETTPFDLVITDLRMPGLDGMSLLGQIVARWPDVPVVMLTAHGTVPLAVEALKAGAADFVLKPFDREEVLFVVRKALAGWERQAEAPPADPAGAGEFVGTSPAMQAVHDLVRKAAPGTATVLVLGESGTGKELVAHAVHKASARSDKPFVKLNCAAFPDQLLESELFGYEKGAFTGAGARKPGRIELAHQGTLFLDEIGDISPHLQVKLLRVLQEREIERLGGTTTVKVDLRVVAATHRNLPEMIAKGEFREDLYWRLHVIPIVFRRCVRGSRTSSHCVGTSRSVFAKANGKRMEIAQSAIERLTREPWPGNMRELQNFVERLVVLSDGPVIELHDVERELARRPGLQALASAAPADAARTGRLDAARRDTEKEAIVDALARSGGSRTVAARILGVSRSTLYNKLREHGLE